MRDFLRFHLFKVIMGIVIIQLGVFAWLQSRNHRPEAIVDEVTVSEGHSVKIRPLGNDEDKDDDELTLQEISDPIHGKIKRDKNVLIYQAGVGFAGVDSFKYVISDGDKESKGGFIKVKINKNQHPLANNDRANLYVGEKTTIHVLGNDKDSENDSIFISEFDIPNHGHVYSLGNKFIYSSTSNSAIRDSFQYTISDGFHDSQKATVVIDVLAANTTSYPWLSSEIGNTAIHGSLTVSSNKLVQKGSGTDIWGQSDGFNYTHRYITGDCELYAKVEQIENTDPWAKAGIMIRESKDQSAKNVFLALSAQNGPIFQQRKDTGNNSDSFIQFKDFKAPYFLKLIRKGNEFSAFVSANGKNWKQAAPTKTIQMSPEVYVGFALTSHNNSKLGSATFSNYVLKGKPAKFEFNN